MSALVVARISESVVGVPSCIVATGEVSKGAGAVSSVSAGSDFCAISPSQGTSGDSRVEAGGGSIMGVVWITEDGGTGDEEESCEDEGCVSGSLPIEKHVSSSSGRSEFACVSRGCKTIVVGSSALAKSGSVMREALCKGVEDNKCSLLACITASLPIAIGVGKEESEWPLGSFLCSGLVGCTSMKAGTSPVRSTADDAVESIVETAVAAASCRGVSPTSTLV